MTDYTYSTGNPIGSTDVRDGVDNLKSFDVLLNSADDTYQDRLGNTVPTAAGAIKRLGPVRVDWTFTTGGTLNYPNEAALNPADGNYYGWTGAFPKVVAPGTDPAAVTGYVPLTDSTLRSELSGAGGADMVGTDDGRSVQERLGAIPDEVDAAGTAANLINQHNNDAAAHPQLSAFITAEADRAEQAADAASVNADIFESTSAGIAATTSGQYFSVVSPTANSYLDLYRNSSGVAVFQKSHPSTKLVDELNSAKNKLTGDDGFSLDGSDGLSTLELKRGTAKALVIGDYSSELMTFDTESESVVVPSSELGDANITAVLRTSDSLELESENTEDLTVAHRAKVIGNAKAELVFDTENNELVSTFKIVDKSQNKGISFDNDVPDIITGVPLGYQLSDRLYQATATITKSGSRFWLAWRADKNVAAEAPGNFFVIGYSDDNCTTVTESHIVKFSNDNHQIVDPMLWTEPATGEVWLFWGSFGKAQAQDGVCGCWCSVLENPNATLGFSWSKPHKYRNIGDPRRPVRIAGKWVQCIDMWRSDAAFPPLYPETAGCEFVEFNPLTKSTVNIGHNTPNNPAGGGTYSGFFETEVIQLTDGRLMSTTRGLAGTELTRSFSTDGGKTWSAQEEYLTLGDVSSSRIWLGRTPSGRILIAYNNDFVRRSLTIKLSEDDGETFPYSVVLEGAASPETVSYPIVAFDGDTIYTAYDYGRGTANEIRVTITKESEIVSGTAVPQIHIVSGPTL